MVDSFTAVRERLCCRRHTPPMQRGRRRLTALVRVGLVVARCVGYLVCFLRRVTTGGFRCGGRRTWI